MAVNCAGTTGADQQTKKLIGHFGQVAPIIVDTNGVIIDGHAVWQAMRELGSGDIATITVAGRTDPEIKALRLALNRLSTEAALGQPDNCGRNSKSCSASASISS